MVTERATPQRQQSTHGMSNSASNDSNLSEQAQEHPEINVSVNPANNNNINDNEQDNDSHSEDGTQQVRVCTFYCVKCFKWAICLLAADIQFELLWATCCFKIKAN